MATSKRKREEHGFECEFVEEPPTKYVQLECPLCLQVLREPYQAPCCGKSFCKVCVERVKTDKMPCPTCNEKELVIFRNKGLQCSLYQFEVFCSHKQEGCEWKGELGQLDNHLNLSPQPDKQLEGCDYSEIECTYCSELFMRPSIAAHQTEHCPKRPFTCEHCQKYNSHYEDVINNHWPVCGYHPVECPDECGATLKRQDLENHVTKDCPETVIACDFHHVGCDVKLPRKDMPAHLKENLVIHMSLQARTLQTKVEHLEKEIKTLRQENKVLQQQYGSHAGTAPCDLFMLNVRHYIQYDLGRQWYSPSFYTHERGYKLELCVCSNEENTHFGVFLHLLRGEYDDSLTWPFKGCVTVHLVDQTKEADYSKPYWFRGETSKTLSRVTEGERGESRGFSEFISHAELRLKYLKNNCLHFRVTFDHRYRRK